MTNLAGTPEIHKYTPSKKVFMDLDGGNKTQEEAIFGREWRQS